VLTISQKLSAITSKPFCRVVKQQVDKPNLQSLLKKMIQK